MVNTAKDYRNRLAQRRKIVSNAAHYGDTRLTFNANPEGCNQHKSCEGVGKVFKPIEGKGAKYQRADTFTHEYRIAHDPKKNEHVAIAIRRLANGKPNISPIAITKLGSHKTEAKAKEAVIKHAEKAGFRFQDHSGSED